MMMITRMMIMMKKRPAMIKMADMGHCLGLTAQIWFMVLGISVHMAHGLGLIAHETYCFSSHGSDTGHWFGSLGSYGSWF